MSKYVFCFDETGGFRNEKSAIVGFYVKYEGNAPTYLFTEKLQETLNEKFQENIGNIKSSYGICNLTLKHGTELRGHEKRDEIQTALAEMIKGNLESLKDENYTFKVSENKEYKAQPVDYKIVIISQELAYNNIDFVAKVLEENKDNKVTEEELKIVNSVLSSKTYLDMMAEGVVQIWNDITSFDSKADIRICISNKLIHEKLFYNPLENYIKAILLACGRLLDGELQTKFYKDMLGYRIDIDTNKKNKNGEPIYDHKYLKFAVEDFENYLNNLENIAPETPGERNNISEKIISHPWKFNNFQLLFANKNEEPNILTVYADSFANPYYHAYIRKPPIENFQDIFSQNTKEYKTLGVSSNPFVECCKLLKDKNIYGLIDRIVISPSIKQEKEDHDRKYAKAYKYNVEVVYKLILDGAVDTFNHMSDLAKRTFMEQMIAELKNKVSQHNRKEKNKLVVEKIRLLFKNSFEKYSWMNVYSIDLDLFLLKIYLDLNEIKLAKELSEEIKNKLDNPNKTFKMSNQVVNEKKGIRRISLLNYYSDMFMYDDFNKEYDDCIKSSDLSDVQKGKVVNIRLNLMLKDVKLADEKTIPELVDKIEALKDEALKYFEYEPPEMSLRTYQICAQLFALLKDKRAVNYLYKAAGLDGAQVTLDNFYKTITENNKLKKDKMFLYVVFLDCLINIPSLRNNFFILDEKGNCKYMLFDAFTEAVYPECIIQWRLAKLEKVLSESDRKLMSSVKYGKITYRIYTEEKMKNSDENHSKDYSLCFLQNSLDRLANVDSSVVFSAIRIAILGEKFLIDSSPDSLTNLKDANNKFNGLISNIIGNNKNDSEDKNKKVFIQVFREGLIKNIEKSTNPKEIKNLVKELVNSVPF